MIKRLLFAALVPMLCPYFGRAQTSPLGKEYKLKYPNEASVHLLRSKAVTIRLVADTLQMTAEVNESILFLRDQTSWDARFRVHGSDFQAVSDLVLKTARWERGKYKETEITDFVKKREEDATFYDDSYFYALELPDATTDNMNSWHYRETYRDVRFLSGFYFYASRPVIKNQYTVTVADGIELGTSILNDPDHQIHFEKTSANGMTTYSWTLENMNTVPNEADTPAAGYYLPQAVAWVKTFTNSKGKQNVLNSLDDMHKWYRQTIENLESKPAPGVEKVVKELVKPGDSEWDIVRKVYYWVQHNIRYIAFENGMRGLIPHPAEYVCEVRYGDCKDMASTIVRMLHAAGVSQAYYTWIGTRDLPYRYTEFPTPIVDNHMIATYRKPDGTYVFLDGTSNWTQAGLPSEMIQGKEAFILLSPQEGYVVKTVPPVSADVNFRRDSAVVVLNGNGLKGTGKTQLGGYRKVDASYALDKTQETVVLENVVSWVTKGSNKFFLDKYTLGNLRDLDKPLSIDYEFRVGDYVSELDDERYVNLHLNKPLITATIAPARKLPYKSDHFLSDYYVVTLDIPEGYEVTYVPPAVSDDGIIAFRRTCAVSQGKVVQRIWVSMSRLMVNPADFAAWNASLKKMSTAFKETVVLKKKQS